METQVKERSMLFSGAMVRALLAGTKTQTRRIVKGELAEDFTNAASRFDIDKYVALGGSPYGQPGDRLYVREDYYQRGHWEEVPGVKTKGGQQKWKFVADAPEILFEAPESYRKGRHHKDAGTTAWHKRLGRFMPRAASRILLEIVVVRVERLQDISEADAVAEGLEWYPDEQDNGKDAGWQCYPKPTPGVVGLSCNDPRYAYETLWRMINGPDSWTANPWVWVVTSRRIDPAVRPLPTSL